jgi:hypothetical protein
MTRDERQLREAIIAAVAADARTSAAARVTEKRLSRAR